MLKLVHLRGRTIFFPTPPYGIIYCREKNVKVLNYSKFINGQWVKVKNEKIEFEKFNGKEFERLTENTRH